MVKSMALAFLLMPLCAYNVLGQESAKNAIYGGIGVSVIILEADLLPGLNIEYERSLNSMFSIGIDIGTEFVILPYAEIKGRWHPWSKSFFVGLSLGIYGFSRTVVNTYSNTFLSISPSIGLKIGIGGHNKWVIMPSITSRMLINPKNGIWLAGEILKINFSIGYQF